jgi:hypothetical protein
MRQKISEATKLADVGQRGPFVPWFWFGTTAERAAIEANGFLLSRDHLTEATFGVEMAERVRETLPREVLAPLFKAPEGS